MDCQPLTHQPGAELIPSPLQDPSAGPDPQRERATGFDAWTARGLDSMLVVPRDHEPPAE